MSPGPRSKSNTDPLVIFARGPRSLRRKKIRLLAERVAQDVAKGGSFCCRLTNDAELRQLNREFLKLDQPTDVLSFPSASPDGALGDLAISWERARDQAKQFGHSIEAEIGVLLLHGVLHLLGYDHEADRGRMARAERGWREKLGLPTGMIERAKDRRAARG
jgi:probable rRNA maturation factor